MEKEQEIIKLLKEYNQEHIIKTEKINCRNLIEKAVRDYLALKY